MKKYKVYAENTTYYSLEVEANSIEEANKIAEDSDGGEWTEDSYGKWIISDDLTHEAHNENKEEKV